MQECAPAPTEPVEDQDAKLNAIVGAALRALVESGAEDHAVGAFAAAHRLKVAQILGMAAAAPAGPPELLGLIRQAVRAELEQTGHAAGAKPVAKRINVVVGGKRTSVTVDPEVFRQLAQTQGGQAKATATIRELAAQAPADAPKRSGWVEARLVAIIELAGDPGAPGSRTH